MCTLPLVIRLFYFLGGFYIFFRIIFQHCFICRPSDSTVPTDAGIEPRTQVHCQSDALTTRLDLIRTDAKISMLISKWVEQKTGAHFTKISS
jgi:hypothetical protein